MTRPVAPVFALILAAMLAPGHLARAQTPPQIQLPPAAQPATPQSPAPQSPAPLPPAAANPVQVPPAAAGEIRLPTPPVTGAEVPAGPVTLAEPPPRDGPDAPRTALRDLVLSLAPAGPVPPGAPIGAGITEPGILRLTGETASVDMLLHLPETVAPPDELHLTLRSSVNVLPQTSELGLTINGTPVPGVPLTQIGPFGRVAMPAPGLTAGLNHITLNLRQPHRIYCGPDATFAVWTEIDLAASGVTVPSAALVTELDGFLAGLQTQAAGGQPLAIMTDETTDPAIIRQVAGLIADLAGGPVPVAVRSFYDMTPPGPVSVALIASDRTHYSFRRSARNAIVLQLDHAGGDLPDLSSMTAAPAPALAPPVAPTVALRLDEPMRFDELGVGDFAGNTHYFNRAVPFTLPDDWMLLANQRARMDLHYGFARGLPAGALVLVKVNGQTVRLLPLDQGGGQLLPVLDIRFAANILRAGHNEVTFEMIVPGDPPDEACAPRRADMLVVMGDSSLTVPSAPRMRMGGLAAPLRALDGRAITVPAEARNRADLAREIVSMTALLPATGTVGSDTRLSVVRVEDAGLIPAGAYPGLTPRRIVDALIPPAPVATVAQGQAPAAAPRFRLSEDGPETMAAPDAGGFWSGLAGGFDPAGWLSAQGEQLRDSLFLIADGPLADWLATRNGRALLLLPDPDQPAAMWLVLGSSTPADEAARALGRLRQNGLARGDAALLQADGSWQIWSSGRPPQLLEPLRPGNALAVLGNYASWSPLLFTVVLVLLALLSCLPALLYILTSRRHEGAGR